MPLPDCASVETQDAGADGWKHPDCRLMFADESGLALEARYTPAEDDSTKITVQVVAPGDATLQTIEETMGNTFNGVTLQDIDKDGKLDIQIPLETGNVNTSWAIWRQRDDKSFIRIGEPNGVSIEKTDSGYIAAQARSSANEWGISFYKLEADELKPVATADVIAQGEPDKITGVECICDRTMAAWPRPPDAGSGQGPVLRRAGGCGYLQIGISRRHWTLASLGTKQPAIRDSQPRIDEGCGPI